MKNKNQTSIDFLIECLDGERHLTENEIKNLIKKARKKHQSEITKSYDKGYDNGYVDNGLDGANYYFDTFKIEN